MSRMPMVRSDLCPEPAPHKCVVLLGALCVAMQCLLSCCAVRAVLCLLCCAVLCAQCSAVPYDMMTLYYSLHEHQATCRHTKANCSIGPLENTEKQAQNTLLSSTARMHVWYQTCGCQVADGSFKAPEGLPTEGFSRKTPVQN